MNHYIFNILDTADRKHFIVRGYTTDHNEKLICVWEYETSISGNYKKSNNFHVLGGLRAYDTADLFYNCYLYNKQKIKIYLRSFNKAIMVSSNNYPSKPSESNPYKL